MTKEDVINKGLMDGVTKFYGDACLNCGSKTNIEYHHIVPLYNRGKDIPSNIAPLCRRCHVLAAMGRYLPYENFSKN